MVFSRTIIIALTSSVGAILVSSTLLFPIIRDLNHTIARLNSIEDPVENKCNKTVQVISKDQNHNLKNVNTHNRMTNEHPTIQMKYLHPVNDSKIQEFDTSVKSNILKEDIPHHSGN